MGKRYALNFGVSVVDDDHYDSPLPFGSGTATAEYYTTFFKKLNFDSSLLFVNKDGSSENLIKELLKMVRILEEDDLLVISFCGHTFGIKENYDLINSKNEDEGWVMRDRVIFHFEIWHLIAKISKGVRVVIISDSCFSDITSISPDVKSYLKGKRQSTFSVKYFFEKHQDFYGGILAYSGEPKQREIKPSVVILSAANEDSIIDDFGQGNLTLFTYAFDQAWNVYKRNKKSFHLSDFFDEISWQMFYIIALPFNGKNFSHIQQFTGKIIPQWHYYQGYTYTKLRIQKPIFKNQNN